MDFDPRQRRFVPRPKLVLGAVAGLTVLAFSLHFLYRWKTRTWTRAWGGWNDLAAGRD